MIHNRQAEMLVGVVGDELFLVPLEQARADIAAMKAVSLATTYGEIRAVIARYGTPSVDEDEFIDDLDDEPEEWPLPDETPFDADSHPAYFVDFDTWRPLPYDHVDEWMPADLKERFGHPSDLGMSMLNSEGVTGFRPGDKKALTTELSRRGWLIVEDDGLLAHYWD